MKKTARTSRGVIESGESYKNGFEKSGDVDHSI